MFTFHQTILSIGSIVLLMAFALSISIRNKYLSPKSLNYFFIVPLIGILSTLNSILTNVLKIFGVELAGLIERLMVMFDFLFWLYFFSSIGIRVTNKKGRGVLLSVGLSILFIVLSVNFGTNKFHHYTISLFLIAEIAFCLLYFNKLFSDPPKQLLARNPVFLIVTGLLIKCAIAIPTHLASEIMFVGKNSALYLIIFPISNIAILFMYIFFMYAFLSIRKEQMKEVVFTSEIQKI